MDIAINISLKVIGVILFLLGFFGFVGGLLNQEFDQFTYLIYFIMCFVFIINGLAAFELVNRGYPGRVRSFIGVLSISLGLILLIFVFVRDAEIIDFISSLFIIIPLVFLGGGLIYSGYKKYLNDKREKEIDGN